MKSILKSEPTLLFYDGDFQQKAMKDERITRKELKQGIRKAGFVSFDEISAIILESDGKLTVMSQSQKRQLSREDFIFIE
ncbi:MAG: DUF421 domain-containing protein [Alkalibacterium sp.]|nr:DUF421 domain-containing protein [Alkalibacterium sp.]